MKKLLVILLVMVLCLPSCVMLEDIRSQLSEPESKEESSSESLPSSSQTESEPEQPSEEPVSEESSEEPVSEEPSEEESSEEESQTVTVKEYKGFLYTGYEERDVSKLIDELAVQFDKLDKKGSFYYQDIYTGNTISYNSEQVYRAASVVKAVYALYLIENNTDMEHKITFAERHQKVGGSGILNKKGDDGEYKYKAGIKFEVDTLIEYAIRYSDNAAYQMLYEEYGFDDFNAYCGDMGIDIRCSEKGSLEYLGYLTSEDCNAFMRRIYDLSQTDKNVKKLLGYLTKSSYNYLLSKGLGDKVFARKYGYMSGTYKALHETGIVVQDDPYIISVLTNINPANGNGRTFFQSVAKAVDAFHDNQNN